MLSLVGALEAALAVQLVRVTVAGVHFMAALEAEVVGVLYFAVALSSGTVVLPVVLIDMRLETAVLLVLPLVLLVVALEHNHLT